MQHLTREELLKLLSVARSVSFRNYVGILVGYRHGLRVSEIVGRRTRLQGSFENREKAEVRRRDFRGATIRETTRKAKIGRVAVYQVLTPQPTFTGGLTPESFRDGFLTVKRLKGSNKTIQPLMSDEDPLLDELAAVNELLRTVRPGQLLFPITRMRFWEIIKEYGHQAGIPAHKLFPHILKHSIAMQTIEKAGIQNVRAFLGHKSISSTGAYLQVDDQRASQAIAAAMHAQ